MFSIDSKNNLQWFLPEVRPPRGCIVLVKYKDEDDHFYDSAAVNDRGRWFPDRVNIVAWRFFTNGDIKTK